MGQSQTSPWTNTRLHYHLERQLCILVLKNMADLSLYQATSSHWEPTQQPSWSFSIRSCLPVSRLTPMGLTLLWWGGAHSPAEGPCCQWSDPPRDQPLEKRREVWAGETWRAGLATVCDPYWSEVGNAYANLKALPRKLLPRKRKQAHTIFFSFKVNGMGQCKGSTIEWPSYWAHVLWAEQRVMWMVWLLGGRKGLLEIHSLAKALIVVARPTPGSLPLTSSSLAAECHTSGETAGGG